MKVLRDYQTTNTGGANPGTPCYLQEVNEA